MTKWSGTYDNYKAYHKAHDPLVRIMLHGVAGVSPKNGVKQVPKATAAKQLQAAKRALLAMQAQRPAPTQEARDWTRTLIGKMRDLIRGAERVYEGVRLPKLGKSYYHRLDQRLGVRK